MVPELKYLKSVESQISLENQIITLAIFAQFLHSIEFQEIFPEKFEIWGGDHCLHFRHISASFAFPISNYMCKNCRIEGEAQKL